MGSNEGPKASFEITSTGFAGTVTLLPPVAGMGRVEAGSETSHASDSEAGRRLSFRTGRGFAEQTFLIFFAGR